MNYVKCPRCGSGEDYDMLPRWGRIAYYDFQCCCGCEWEGGFSITGDYFVDKQ